MNKKEKKHLVKAINNAKKDAELEFRATHDEITYEKDKQFIDGMEYALMVIEEVKA